MADSLITATVIYTTNNLKVIFYYILFTSTYYLRLGSRLTFLTLLLLLGRRLEMRSGYSQKLEMRSGYSKQACLARTPFP